MIPILFDSNETSFQTKGLGALTDTISVKVSRVLNGKDELVMTYPDTGTRFADLVNDRIIYAQPEYKKDPQPYQIYRITKPLKGIVSVYAKQVCSQRIGYIPVKAFSAGSITETFLRLPQYMAESNPFTFWTDKSTVANFVLKRPASLGNVLGGMEGSILDTYRGEYEFDGFTIKLWNHRGSNNGVTLRYGKNITDIEQSEDFSSIVTGVCPYWEGLDGTVVTLPEVIVQGTYANTYSFRRTVVVDFSDQFLEQPTEQQLRSAAQSYVSSNNIGLPNLNLTVSFEHLAQYSDYAGIELLERMNLGDTVSIYYPPLEVSGTARIVSTVYDSLNEKYDRVQIGSIKANLETVMTKIDTTTSTLKETLRETIPNALADAISAATDKITGVNGGYVILHQNTLTGQPYEILIMDTDDINTAQKVIRLNNAGIGFSQNGYNGTYRTAWTIDGNFVADFITTGTLNANLVKAGLLSDQAGRNYWNMATGDVSFEQLNLVSQKIENIGGRNLIINTLSPDVSTATKRPRLYAQSVATGVQPNANVTVAEHGMRTTNTTAVRPYIMFGTSTIANASLMGLEAGKTYTMSFKCTFKLLSNYAGSDEYQMRATLYTDAENPGVSFSAAEYIDLLKITPGQGRYRTASWTFTIPSNATAAYIIFRGTDTTAADYGATDMIELANLKLEEGELSTAWSPAPEDMVGNDEIITKINVSPESVQIQANKISLAGKTIDLTGDTIQITSDHFSVDSDGYITATGVNLTGSFNITGGSVNITTTSETNDIIQLSSGNWTSLMSPLQFDVRNTGTKRRFLVQAGAFYGYSDYTASTPVQEVYLSSTGTLYLGGGANDGFAALLDSSGTRTISLWGSSGTIDANAISATGAISGASLSVTGAISGASLTLTGTSGITGPNVNLPSGGFQTSFRIAPSYFRATGGTTGGLVALYADPEGVYTQGLYVRSDDDTSSYTYLRLKTDGLTFYANGTTGTVTATYPATGLGVVNLNNNVYESYTATGTHTFTLSGGIYLVATARYNSTNTNNDALWLVSVYPSGTSHALAIRAPQTTATSISLSGGTMTLTTGTAYQRVTITKLS